VEDAFKTPVVDPPRGIYPARVDDKGRLKLPAVFHQYLARWGEPRVFVTSLDTRMARIYPIALWRDNEALFEQYSDDPDGASDIAFVANDLGADAEIDGQGRVLMPQEMRRLLGIENQPVWLDCYKGRINVYSKAVYEERKQRAMENVREKLLALEKKGLK
jgi:MraZ protein